MAGSKLVLPGGTFSNGLQIIKGGVLSGRRLSADDVKALADVAPGEVVQLERLGYFAADPVEPRTFHRTVGLRDEWANIQKRG